MSNAQFAYTYEYQGNAAKLVHTPLTDRCYLTLVQGMHMGFGGNPYGPAGTGKTESVKALGNAFGRQVLVFNCFYESHQLLTQIGRWLSSYVPTRPVPPLARNGGEMAYLLWLP